MVNKSPKGVPARQWQPLVDSLRRSPNPFERDALYFGVVAADGSPILVDRQQLRQHAHFLGSTGGGKSSLGISPLIEQLISFGDSTVVILDLKGDSNELLASAEHASRLQEAIGNPMPVKYFTLENGKATSIFNPLASAEWDSLTQLQRTDILAAACGLVYGSDYGRAFFTSANSAVIYAAEQLSSSQKNFSTLLKDVSDLVIGRNGTELPSELRRAGVHAYEVLSRLSSIKQLNLSGKEVAGISKIDLVDCFKTPQILYFKLPSSISQETSGAVARLVSYFLMTAAHHVSNRRQVYLVVDEFQRMAAESLSILFEQARSLDLSLILSNQSIDDLGKHKSSLLNVIETNCNTRQWFSIATKNDVASVEAISCLRERDDISVSVQQSSKGQSTSTTVRRVLVPRISAQDAAYVSNDPHLSILRLTGVRKGYSQYRGLPFIAENGFHITEEEYLKRQKYSWPNAGKTMMISAESPPPSLANKKGKTKATGFPKDAVVPKNEIEFSEWTPEGL